MTEPTSGRVIPFASFTPDACETVAIRVEEAAAHFTDVGLDRPLLTRLDAVVKHLRIIANRNSFGANPEALQQSAEAITAAMDFIQIGSVLPDNLDDDTLEELTAAVNGNLEGIRKKRQPREFQSQFWVGMMLARGGLRPGIAPRVKDRAHIDFVATIDTLQVGVEIKRPESFRSASKILDRAAGQLRDYGLPGLIVLDLSDCIAAVFPRPQAGAFSPDQRRAIRKIFNLQHDRLAQRAPGYTLSDKYSRIVGLLTLVRVVEWPAGGNGYPVGSILVHSAGYPLACQGLVDVQTDRLRNLIRLGIQEVAGGPRSTIWET